MSRSREETLYSGGNLRINEVFVEPSFQETVVLDRGIELALREVKPDTLRLTGHAAIVERKPSKIDPFSGLLDRAYKLYSVLYPDVTRSQFDTTLEARRVAGVFAANPETGNPDDLTITFSISQTGRLNGFALNLVLDQTADPDAIVVLNMDGETNVPLGIGGVRHKGLVKYDNPDWRWDREGNAIVVSERPELPSQAILFIIPGRIPIKPIEKPDTSTTEGWVQSGIVSMAQRAIRTTRLSELNAVSPSPDEAPPTPFLVEARWGMVEGNSRVLDNSSFVGRLADDLWK